MQLGILRNKLTLHLRLSKSKISLIINYALSTFQLIFKIGSSVTSWYSWPRDIYKHDACRPSITTWSIWFLVLRSGDCQVALWILRCHEITMFCAAAKDTSLKPLSLVFPWRLYFPTVGPKIPSLPTFALKSLT